VVGIVLVNLHDCSLLRHPLCPAEHVGRFFLRISGGRARYGEKGRKGGGGGVTKEEKRRSKEVEKGISKRGGER